MAILKQEWDELLDLLGSSQRFRKAVLAYKLWLAAPKKISCAEVAKLVGYDPRLDRRVLHKNGRRLIDHMLGLGFQSREAFRTPSKKKRWDPDKQKLKRADWVGFVPKFVEQLQDAEALDLLLEELRGRGFDIKRRSAPPP